MRIALTTIGCKLNQSEITNLKQNLLKAGYIIVPKNQKHDLHIVNACSITHGAEQITRQKIREAKRKAPQSQTFVMGCLNKTIPEINHAFKNSTEILKYVKKNYAKAQYPVPNTQCPKTRALIKIQSGCDFGCTYCIIYKFRGKSKSVTLKKIITQIKNLEKQSYKEIVLVGQNILQYKYQNYNFTQLVKAILQQTNILRIRFSSLDPRLIDGDFLALLKNPHICPHLHLSLQSGSNKILKSMNRNYTTKQYLNIVKQAQKINSLTSITTDIIVGFPGETDKDFQNTLNFVKKIEFLKIHIFPYSERQGTKAANFKNQLFPQIKKERFNQLNALAKKQKAEFCKKIKGETLPVLFEQKRNGYWRGLTSNYMQVKKKSSKNLKNQIVNLKI
ncbi:MAG: tRNA (N(6)-L-threonylcarbamoyladenosine(37)-C(2))-methylthiotransferase MtaB [Candidatus Buchananbacteria bacterium]|nr:tRNA (N(6)-L-threonylcarbamoyladenosine(37)-C(2))-methylthiotransferase MtaB [Candidatus Buchananbacteria bacterium]